MLRDCRPTFAHTFRARGKTNRLAARNVTGGASPPSPADLLRAPSPMEQLPRSTILGTRIRGVASENALQTARQRRPSTSENTPPPAARRRGGTPLAPHLASLLEEYRAKLAWAPLSPESSRTYLSPGPPVPGLARSGGGRRRPAGRPRSARLGGPPLRLAGGREGGDGQQRARRHRRLLLAARAWAAPTPSADLPEQAPRALDKCAALRGLRAAEAHLAPLDRALAGVLLLRRDAHQRGGRPRR